MSIGFQKIPDAICITKNKGSHQERSVFHRRGRLYYKNGTNYKPISLNSTDIEEIDFADIGHLRALTTGALITKLYEGSCEIKHGTKFKYPTWVSK